MGGSGINNNPATIVVSYGGAIGMTDVTHLGWFDIAMMSNIPNVSPKPEITVFSFLFKANIFIFHSFHLKPFYF